MAEAAVPAAKRRILIVDDHPVIRAGLGAALSRQPDLARCGEAGTLAEAAGLLLEHSPDLLLVDLDLEDGNGLDLVREALAMRPDLPCLVLSMHDEEVHAAKALRAGARGYLMKSAPPDDFLAALRAALAGEIAVSDKVKTGLLRRHAAEAPVVRDAVDSLSEREREVFRELGQGAAMRAIAHKLCLSVKTVETHVAHIKRKLGLRSAVELRHRAFRAAADAEAGAASR
jgi:DNA-binding NarL/FixJ family response regulator